MVEVSTKDRGCRCAELDWRGQHVKPHQSSSAQRHTRSLVLHSEADLTSIEFVDYFSHVLQIEYCAAARLTFSLRSSQCMDGVTLPRGLRSLTFGYYFNQIMGSEPLPRDLRSLTFGYHFKQRMET